jgi:hypothetical protein
VYSNHFLHAPFSLISADIDNQVDTPPNVRFGNIQLQVSRAADRKACEPANSFLGAAGMNGGERPTVAGIRGVQQSQGFRATNFAHDDAVRVMPEDSSEHIVEGDPAVMSVGLGLRGDDVGFADMQLSGVLDDEDALVVRDGVASVPRSVDLPLAVPPAMSMFCPSRTASVSVAA